MARKTRKSTKQYVLVEVDNPTPKRYRWIDRDKGILEIDMRCVRKPYGNDPIHMRARRRFNSPQHMQALCDEYFASCDGVLYNPKTGKPYLDRNGEPVIGQIKPYTVTGLALWLDLTTESMKEYEKGMLDDYGYDIDEINQYSFILRKARMRIEEYAETRLYDRDGYNGSKFVLDCAFNWNTRKEIAEIDSMIATKEIKAKELELKIRAQELKEKTLLGEADEDSEITINIKRKTRED